MNWTRLMKPLKAKTPTPAQVAAMKKEAAASRYPEVVRQLPKERDPKRVAELLDIGVSPAFALAYLFSE